MHISHGPESTHLTRGNRSGEFVAVIDAILPDITRRLESVAILTMVAAFWGVVIYLALVAFAA